MLVSICCITYNHEKFIAEALDGFLKQQTNFDIEIVINDDASIDSTPEIIQNYAELFPDKFNIKLNSSNVGMMKNFANCLSRCTGKYIAICEGDDYWIDPYKLHKQIAFLERNPTVVYSYHPHLLHSQILNRTAAINITKNLPPPRIHTCTELANGFFHQTASFVFKADVLKDLPNWFEKSPMGDIPLAMLAGKKGLFVQHYDTMSVYRDSNGYWTKMDKEKRYLTWMKTLQLIQSEFYEKKFIEVRARLLWNIMRHNQELEAMGNIDGNTIVKQCSQEIVEVFGPIMQEYHEMKIKQELIPSIRKSFNVLIYSLKHRIIGQFRR